jgi:uncharacterized protein (DUF4415 family)
LQGSASAGIRWELGPLDGFARKAKLVPDFFAHAIIWPGPKKQITLRVDPDVLTFFRKQGKGYQSTMNAVLRKYVEAQRRNVG